ncbi:MULTISPECIES: DUF3011 domain-containing protein [unclassified Mesorhizobium]|uniref:DUF3011 domain-containing protein n=1 Tax=unclassified Mesorhizobium TaxID=325217 RepID=UPI0013DEB957|nr:MULTISPECIES: DUF3011 domain-containing protein [unclassified Mesorhizobium]
MKKFPSAFFSAALVVFPGISLMPAAAAPHTVDCSSVKNRYVECAARYAAPVLVMQKSSRPCILNNTWGYNPETGYIWVTGGCRGVFADQDGYHHGQAGGMDPRARRYSNQGNFIGYGPLIVVKRNTINQKVMIQKNELTIINNRHDTARVADPEATREIDSTPQFDRNGEPNFDTEGNYIGPHGLGALVDAPEAESAASSGDDQSLGQQGNGGDVDGTEDEACGGDSSPCP